MERGVYTVVRSGQVRDASGVLIKHNICTALASSFKSFAGSNWPLVTLGILARDCKSHTDSDVWRLYPRIAIYRTTFNSRKRWVYIPYLIGSTFLERVGIPCHSNGFRIGFELGTIIGVPYCPEVIAGESLVLNQVVKEIVQVFGFIHVVNVYLGIMVGRPLHLSRTLSHLDEPFSHYYHRPWTLDLWQRGGYKIYKHGPGRSFRFPGEIPPKAPKDTPTNSP